MLVELHCIYLHVRSRFGLNLSCFVEECTSLSSLIPPPYLASFTFVTATRRRLLSFDAIEPCAPPTEKRFSQSIIT